MSVEIEIKVGEDKPEMPAGPEMSKDQLQAVLKGLLEKTGAKDPVAHQAKIDEIIKKISELEDKED